MAMTALSLNEADVECALSPAAAAHHRPSFESLDTDVLILIFEEVYNPVPDFLRLQNSCKLEALRSMSRRLREIVTPFRYRYIQLNTNLLELCANKMAGHLDAVWSNVSQYTRHIVIDCELDWHLANKLLLCCTNIDRIDWSWWDYSKQYPTISQPVQSAINFKFPYAKLHILEYPWPCRFTPSWESVGHYKFTIPLTNIVYISMTQHQWSCPRHFESPNRFETVIARSQKLETLELGGHIYLMFKDIRFPPIKNLFLKGWILGSHTKEQFQQLWDVSKLESLEFRVLTGLSLFLSGFPRDCLPNLKKLIVDGELHPSRLEALTPFVNDILDGASDMEEIDIRCNLPLLSIESILKHGTHLRILRIQDPSGWWDGNRRDDPYGGVLYRALSIADLTRLRDSCPRLKDMSLDLVVDEHNINDFVSILATFRSLQYLQLNMESFCLENPKADDLITAKKLASCLMTTKLGLPMKFFGVGISGFVSPYRADHTADWYTEEWFEGNRKRHLPDRVFKFWWNGDRTVELTEQVRVRPPIPAGPITTGSTAVVSVAAGIHDNGTCSGAVKKAGLGSLSRGFKWS